MAAVGFSGQLAPSPTPRPPPESRRKRSLADPSASHHTPEGGPGKGSASYQSFGLNGRASTPSLHQTVPHCISTRALDVSQRADVRRSHAKCSPSSSCWASPALAGTSMQHKQFRRRFADSARKARTGTTASALSDKDVVPVPAEVEGSNPSEIRPRETADDSSSSSSSSSVSNGVAAATAPAPSEASTAAADASSSNGAVGAAAAENGLVTTAASTAVEPVETPAASGGLSWLTSGAWQRRWTVVTLCFFAFLLCNMDRVNMSIAILPMAEEYAWTPATVGLVQSSFFWGYLLTQIAGGVWADTYGGKQVLGFGVVWWSLATILTPLAAKVSLPFLLFARACMGVGEGVAMPAMNNLLSKWVPVNERSRSLALVYSGMYLGSVAGLSLSPGLIHWLGWPSVFYSFGSLGVVWFYFWQQKARSSPSEDPDLSPAERQLLLAANNGAAKVDAVESDHSGVAHGAHFGEAPLQLNNIPWKLLLSKAPVWAIIISHFCHNWGVFILLTWMPTYYHDVLGFNLTESGLFAVLPWLTMAVASNVGGWIADSLISRGFSVTLVRKVMQTIGFLGPAVCLTLLSSVKSPTAAVLLLMASQGTDAFSQSGLYSNHQDIGPRYAGILLGLSNTAGVLAGVLGTFITGQILQTGSWDDVFKVAVILYLVGTFVWNVFATGERVFD